MNVEELRQEIEQRTGVPASFLTGETAEENIAQAKALLAYKKECGRQYAQQQPKSTKEQFAEWYRAAADIEEPEDAAGAALAEIEEAARVEAGGYPRVTDGGEVGKLSDARPAKEQFEDWLKQATAFNPFTDSDGWTRLS